MGLPGRCAVGRVSCEDAMTSIEARAAMEVEVETTATCRERVGHLLVDELGLVGPRRAHDRTPWGVEMPSDGDAWRRREQARELVPFLQALEARHSLTHRRVFHTVIVDGGSPGLRLAAELGVTVGRMLEMLTESLRFRRWFFDLEDDVRTNRRVALTAAA